MQHPLSLYSGGEGRGEGDSMARFRITFPRDMLTPNPRPLSPGVPRERGERRVWFSSAHLRGHRLEQECRDFFKRFSTKFVERRISRKDAKAQRKLNMIQM
jgi:hypothetical protein